LVAVPCTAFPNGSGQVAKKEKPNFKSFGNKKSGAAKSTDPRPSKKQTAKTHGEGVKSNNPKK